MKERYELVKDNVITLKASINYLLNDTHSRGSCQTETVNKLSFLNNLLDQIIRTLENEEQSRLHAGMCY